ncbi:MAG: hypothetical protein P9L98_04820 [Candidatus Kaelpia imicola]|nr:hypothetical protein [Candidatus Kaelpia imicola]
MLKNFKKAAVILVGTILVFSQFSEACVGIYGQSSRRMIYNYLATFYYINNSLLMNAHDGVYLEAGLAPKDHEIEFLGSENYNNILNEIDDYFKDKGYFTWEQIVAKVNDKLPASEVQQFRDKILASDSFTPIRGAIDTMATDEEWGLGLDLDAEITFERKQVFPVVDDTDFLSWSTVQANNKSRALVDRVPDTATMREILEGYAIESFLKGINPNYIAEGMYQAAEIYNRGKLDVSKYFDSGFNKNNPEHLASLFYFGLQRALITGNTEVGLSGYGAKELIARGYASLVDDLEAFQTGALVSRDDFGRVVSQNPIGETLIEDYIQSSISLAIEAREKLNDTEYYGEDLSLEDTYQAGLITSWVKEMFNRVREKSFNPIDQSWTKYYTLDDAKEDVLGFIGYANSLKDNLATSSNFGELDLISDNKFGEHSRRIVNSYADIALTLEDLLLKEAIEEARLEGKDISKEDVQEEVRIKVIDIVKSLMPSGDLGKKLLGSIAGLYGKNEAYFHNSIDSGGDVKDRSALASFTTLIVEMLDYQNYYGLESTDINTLVDERIAMVDLGKRKNLDGLIKDYLGVTKLDFSKGWVSGVYTFWNKVLYAAAENLVAENLDKEVAEEAAFNYVETQINARIKLRDALLDKKILRGQLDERRLPILQAFEQWIAVEESLALGSVDMILATIDSLDINKNNYKESLTQKETQEAFGDPQNIFPRHPTQDEEWDWADIIDVSSYQAGIELPVDNGFAVQPISEPFAALEFPLGS